MSSTILRRLKRRPLWLARWAGALVGGFAVVAGVAGPAAADIQPDPVWNSRQKCDFWDGEIQRVIHGCFASTGSVTDLTTGATVGDGLPVHAGDVLEYRFTLTNNSDYTVTDLSLDGLLSRYDCSPDPKCLYTAPFNIDNTYYDNTGLDPYSIRIEDDPDINNGHVDGKNSPWTRPDLWIVGQAGHLRPGAIADFRGYLPPGETTWMTFQIQVPLNAPTGLQMSEHMIWAHDGYGTTPFGGAIAGPAVVDAVDPLPVPVASPAGAGVAGLAAVAGTVLLSRRRTRCVSGRLRPAAR